VSAAHKPLCSNPGEWKYKNRAYAFGKRLVLARILLYQYGYDKSEISSPKRKKEINMKTKKFETKLTLNKKTITELSEKDMKKLYAGQETMAGPRCNPTEACW
jgi:hypothetical protein